MTCLFVRCTHWHQSAGPGERQAPTSVRLWNSVSNGNPIRLPQR
jgi:hypothetical protein